MKKNKDTYLAGQLIGVEGYVESAAMGILAAIFAYQKLENLPLKIPPIESILGSLYNYVINGNPTTFQPMNANFGILYNSNKHNREESINKSLDLIDKYWAEINERN